jgi:hypothetical protein
MGLLKTVFKVHPGLFGKREKYVRRHLTVISADRLFLLYLSSSYTQRTLLFVIRDHFGTTPLPNLQATLSQDLTVSRTLW